MKKATLGRVTLVDSSRYSDTNSLGRHKNKQKTLKGTANYIMLLTLQKSKLRINEI